MASGLAQHGAFTVLSTGESGALAKCPMTKDANDGAVLSSFADKLNANLGHRAVFQGKEVDFNSRPDKTTVKLIDGHATGFLSTSKGFAILGDLGLDLLKIETPKVDVGIGFRLDTGINIGSKGARACFAGIGGELVLAEDAGVQQSASSPSGDQPTDVNVAHSTINSIGDRLEGIGFEFWVVKVKVLFK